MRESTLVQRLRLAIIRGHTATVYRLLADGVDANSVALPSGICMLAFAARGGVDLAIIRQLIESGADLAPAAPDTAIPLRQAAMYGQAKACAELLKRGAPVDQEDSDRATALHIAIKYGHYDVCRLLLDAGADVNHADSFCRTPLHRAASYFAALEGDIYARLLVERGASPSYTLKTPSTRYLTPFQLAVKKGADSVVRFFLLECGETASQTTVTGATMLEIAGSDGVQALLRMHLTEEFIVAAVGASKIASRRERVGGQTIGLL
jgi:ankyrin repeat protein